jgi:dTDP-glucose pyrophosphorylase
MNESKNTIRDTITVKEAMSAINDSKQKNVFVLNSINQVIGSVTDGDIRRGILNGASMSAYVTEIMNSSFNFIQDGQLQTQQIRQFKKNGIYLIPILDSKKELQSIINLQDYINILPLEAIIMAGGKGKRLLPFTLKTPKPLLVIGDKPILEHNVDRLKKFGIEKITISINYLKNQIKDYFGTGLNKGIAIDYVEESKPLGTAGAISLISEFSKNHILLMNSDLLTDIDYAEMFDLLLETKADMIVATFPYEVSVPYGVVESDGKFISSLNEKPKYTYYSNAGIYMFKREHVTKIPKDVFFNATDLMEKLLEEGLKIAHYPINTYWLDIGKPRDFEKAQKDIAHLDL